MLLRQPQSDLLTAALLTFTSSEEEEGGRRGRIGVGEEGARGWDEEGARGWGAEKAGGGKERRMRRGSGEGARRSLRPNVQQNGHKKCLIKILLYKKKYILSATGGAVLRAPEVLRSSRVSTS